jgi:hypothetical protein
MIEKVRCVPDMASTHAWRMVQSGAMDHILTNRGSEGVWWCLIWALALALAALDLEQDAPIPMQTLREVLQSAAPPWVWRPHEVNARHGRLDARQRVVAFRLGAVTMHYAGWSRSLRSTQPAGATDRAASMRSGRATIATALGLTTLVALLGGGIGAYLRHHRLTWLGRPSAVPVSLVPMAVQVGGCGAVVSRGLRALALAVTLAIVWIVWASGAGAAVVTGMAASGLLVLWLIFGAPRPGRQRLGGDDAVLRLDERGLRAAFDGLESIPWRQIEQPWLSWYRGTHLALRFKSREAARRFAGGRANRMLWRLLRNQHFRPADIMIPIGSLDCRCGDLLARADDLWRAAHRQPPRDAA